MKRYDIDASEASSVVIEEVAGSLRVKGWGESTVRVDADTEDSVELSKKKDTIILTCDSDCIIRLPFDSTLEIIEVSGEASLKALEAPVKIGTVEGQLLLKNLASVTVNEVNGNLTATHIEGDLSVETIEGSATIRDIDGSFVCENLEGNLSLRGMFIGVSVDGSGNANLRLETVPGSEYKVSTEGSIYCRVEETTDAHVKLHSGSESIIVKISPDGTEIVKGESHEFSLGSEPMAVIELQAEGSVEFVARGDDESYSRSFDFDFDFADDMSGFADLSNLAEEISAQVTDQIEAQIEALNAQLSGLSAQINTAATEQARDAARRAERKIARTQRQLEHKLEHARRRATLKAKAAAERTKRLHLRRPAHGFPPHLPKEPGEPVSDEERQVVLQMVADKKISVDEAEVLLAALEGQPVEALPKAPAELAEPAEPATFAEPATPETPEAPATPEEETDKKKKSKK